MGWIKTTGIVTGVVVLLGGGYVVADAYDVVPGMLTLDAPYPTASPFPSAPGATSPAPMTEALKPTNDKAPVPDAATIQAMADSLAKDPRVGPNVSIVVSDAATKKRIAAVNPDTPRVPASTQKLLTASAALINPGGSVTLPTKAVYSDGVLTLVGGGDMMLAADKGNPNAVNGRAGLGDLARKTAAQLKYAGKTTVALRLDDTLFTGTCRAPTWDPGDEKLGYVSCVQPIGINIGKHGTGEVAPRDPDPAMSAAQQFAKLLQANGITVQGSVSRDKAVDGAQVMGEVRSAPLSDIIDYFLDQSDNTITDVVGRLVAIAEGLPATFDGADQAVLATVSRLGMNTSGIVLKDSSGLARGSQITASQLDQLVNIMVDPNQPKLRSAAVGLPIGGLRGTLSDRYTGDSPGRGVVRAKTGSLPNVTALAGTVVTKDERVLSFTFMADAVPDGGSWGARSALDGFISQLAGCGCRA